MRHVVWLMIGMLATTALGQETETSPHDLLHEEYQRFKQTPVYLEQERISKALQEIENDFQQRTAGYHKQLETLRNSDAWREAYRAYQDLDTKLRKKSIAKRRERAEIVLKEIDSIPKLACPQALALGFNVLTYPQVDGSNSTWPLNIVLACRVLNVPYQWVFPETALHPALSELQEFRLFLPVPGRAMPSDVESKFKILMAVAQPQRKDQVRPAIMINSLLAANTSTNQSYVNLIEGKCDLNLTVRPPSESESKLAKDKGIIIKLEPIARDAMVFFVNRDNPLKNLKQQQVREIYEKKITNWKDLGVVEFGKSFDSRRHRGTDGAISAYTRERDSGSRETFDALVNPTPVPVDESKPWYERRELQLYGSGGMLGPYNQVTEDRYGLAYTFYYFDHFMSCSPYTRTIAIDGIEPSAETIASGKYPWITHVYAAYREGESKDAPSMKLLRWILSDEGQAVVRESGYVPLK